MLFAYAAPPNLSRRWFSGYGATKDSGGVYSLPQMIQAMNAEANGDFSPGGGLMTLAYVLPQLGLSVAGEITRPVWEGGVMSDATGNAFANGVAAAAGKLGYAGSFDELRSRLAKWGLAAAGQKVSPIKVEPLTPSSPPLAPPPRDVPPDGLWPSAGGTMSTTTMLLLGGAVVVLGGILFVMRKRRTASTNFAPMQGWRRKQHRRKKSYRR